MLPQDSEEEENNDRSSEEMEDMEDEDEATGEEDGSTHEWYANKIRADLHKTVKKVRKIVASFKRSPVKNALLQKYVRQEHGK